jgi:hypothetical protein
LEKRAIFKQEFANATALHNTVAIVKKDKNKDKDKDKNKNKKWANTLVLHNTKVFA